ncbi:MAG: hypothetical protein WCC87_08275 [Candidatus Korobacteraceae bacterium]
MRTVYDKRDDTPSRVFTGLVRIDQISHTTRNTSHKNSQTRIPSIAISRAYYVTAPEMVSESDLAGDVARQSITSIRRLAEAGADRILLDGSTPG